jgi:hypothetical protein
MFKHVIAQLMADAVQQLIQRRTRPFVRTLWPKESKEFVSGDTTIAGCGQGGEQGQTQTLGDRRCAA